MKSLTRFAGVVVIVAAPMFAMGMFGGPPEVDRAPPSAPASPPSSAASASPSDSNIPRTASPPAMRFIPEGIDWDAVIGPPPAADSCEAFADMAIVRFEQARRCPPEIDQAWRGVALAPVNFDQPLGSRFEPEFVPKLYALVESAVAEVRAVNGKLKRQYSRPRPFMADRTITPCLPKEEGNSYPSSHATRGMAVGLILAGIFPERREALIQWGRITGYSRVVGGVHYPSDVEAGFRIAERATEEIFKSEAWKAALAECAADIAKVRADAVPVP